MPFCQECGRELAEGARFCATCGTARPDLGENATVSTDNRTINVGTKSTGGGLVLAVIMVSVIIAGAMFLAWTVPTGQSTVTHHDAVSNPFLATKAYDSGADFYLFNRCDMFVLVDGKKYTVPGDEQNDECTIANPADAFKLMAYTHAGGN